MPARFAPWCLATIEPIAGYMSPAGLIRGSASRLAVWKTVLGWGVRFRAARGARIVPPVRRHGPPQGGPFRGSLYGMHEASVSDLSLRFATRGLDRGLETPSCRGRDGDVLSSDRTHGPPVGEDGDSSCIEHPGL